MAQPIQDFGAHYQVTLAPEPFHLQANPEIIGDGLMLAIGLTAETFDRFGSSHGPALRPGFGLRARAQTRSALSDRSGLSGRGSPPGSISSGPSCPRPRGWPVTHIRPDHAWVGCAAPSLDPERDLIRPGQVLYLVLSDGEGADFLVLRFDASGQS